MRSTSKNRCNSHTSVAGKIFQSLFFLAFAAIGSFFLVEMGRTLFQELVTFGWEKAPAVITEAKREAGADIQYRLMLRYRYQYKGRTYQGDRYSVASKTRLDRFVVIEQEEARYRIGSEYEVFVNPSKPIEAVLVRQFSAWMPVWMLLPLVFCIIGFGGIYGIWRRRKITVKNSALRRSSPLSARLKARKNYFVASGVFAVLLLVGLAFGYSMFLKPMLKTMVARSWEKAPCTVISSRVTAHHDSDGCTYGIEIVFRYDYRNRQYSSDQYDFFAGTTSGYDGKQAIVARYPPGTKTFCMVNPEQPEEAVLSTDFRGDYWFGLLPLAFVVFGVVGMVGSLLAWQKKQRTGKIFRATEPESALDFDPQDTTPWLKLRVSPLKRFIGLLLSAIIWNGLTSFFVVLAIRSWQQKEPEWGLFIFVALFVLIGLGLVIMMLVASLDLFTPLPRIRIEPARPRLGDKVTVTWECPKPRSFKHLELWLEGVMKVRTTTKNDSENSTEIKTETFTVISILSSDIEEEMTEGTRSINIPADLMHSWSAKNLKICWQLVLFGKRQFRPQLICEYEIDVRPLTTSKGDKHDTA